MYAESVAHAQLSNALYLGWALPLAAGLALALYRPQVAVALARRWPPRLRRAAVPTS